MRERRPHLNVVPPTLRLWATFILGEMYANPKLASKGTSDYVKKRETVSVTEHTGNCYWPAPMGMLVQMASMDANQPCVCGKQQARHVLQHVHSMIGLLHQPFIWISGWEGGTPWFALLNWEVSCRMKRHAFVLQNINALTQTHT